MGEEVLDESGKFSKEIISQRPEACNLLQIYSAISEVSVTETLKSFEGKEFRVLKEVLAETLIQKIFPIGKEVRKMLNEENYLTRILEEGAQKKRAGRRKFKGNKKYNWIYLKKLEIYLPIAEISQNIFFLLSIGFVAGVLSGMFGVGGGFLTTPILILVECLLQ